MSHQAHRTTSHETIRTWVESRGGHPAAVKGTGGDEDAGLLRVDFGDDEPSLERVSWDQFFKTFDENDLEFLFQDETADGGTSRFCKFVRKAK
jgi:hypothetical protein